MANQNVPLETSELTTELLTQIKECDGARDVRLRASRDLLGPEPTLIDKLFKDLSAEIDRLPQNEMWEERIRRFLEPPLRQDHSISLVSEHDLSDVLKHILDESWAGDPVLPEDAYFKVLLESSAQLAEPRTPQAYEGRVIEQLVDFQVGGLNLAMPILRRYGGLILADDVGLGKTYIAIAILEILARDFDEHAVAIVPPKVLPYWEELAHLFRLSLPVISYGRLEDLEQHSDREVLVIDEAHKFRNNGTQRYEDVQKWLATEEDVSSRKVILLSATPLNNSPQDIKQLLGLFPDDYEPLPYPDGSIDTWYEEVGAAEISMNELLDKVVVRRTRKTIQTNYPNSTIPLRTTDGGVEDVPLTFPKRVMGEDQCLRYNIEEAYSGNMFDEILDVLGEVSFAMYGLADFLRPEHENRSDIPGVMKSGHRMRGQYKVLLLKRMESSIKAFKRSLQTLKNKLQKILDGMARGVVPLIGGSDAESEGDPNVSYDDISEVPAKYFLEEDLRNAVASDLAAIQGLCLKVERIGAAQDLKFIRLQKYLARRRPEDHPTVIFTQFSDTANYLHDQLQRYYSRTGLVTGDTNNPQKLVQRFAPKANRAQNRVDDSDQVDLLVVTRQAI